MDRIEQTAELSVLRALGFAGLAVAMVMLGFSYDPSLAFLVGAILTLLVAVILLYRGLRASAGNSRATHAWIMLNGDFGGLSQERAEKALGPVLQQIYYSFALRVGVIGLILWIISLLIRLAI